MVMLGNTNVTRVRGRKKKERARIARNPCLSTVIYPVTKYGFDRACVCLSLCVCMIKYYTHIYIYPLFLFPDPDKPEGYDEPHSQQTRISKWSIVKTKVYFGRIVTTLVHVPLVPRVSISGVSPCIVSRDSNRVHVDKFKGRRPV